MTYWCLFYQLLHLFICLVDINASWLKSVSSIDCCSYSGPGRLIPSGQICLGVKEEIVDCQEVYEGRPYFDVVWCSRILCLQIVTSVQFG